MAEMKSLNGNTFVDQSARNEIEALKKNGVGGGGGDVSTGAMQAAIAAAIQEHNEQIQVHPNRLDPMAAELLAIKQTVSAIPKFKIEVVTVHPTITEASTTTVYLVPSGGADGNLYTEWICVEKDGARTWEKLGTQNLDLTGYVTDEELNTAVEAALAEAKESGAFDGKDGRDGNDGADGQEGKSAYQIWLDAGNVGTTADFLASLKGAGGTTQVTPLYAKSKTWLEENGERDKFYVLMDKADPEYGFVFGFFESESTQLYVNRLLEADTATRISADASITDTAIKTGYFEGYRVSATAGEVKAGTGQNASGFIPCQYGDTIRVKYEELGTSANAQIIAFYDSSHTFIGGNSIVSANAGTTTTDGMITINTEKFVLSNAAALGSCAYFRFGLAVDFSTLIVTVNQEIIEGGTAGGLGWNNTGHAFVPANYEPRIIALEQRLDAIAPASGNVDTEYLRNWETPIYDANIPVFETDSVKPAKTDAEHTPENAYALYDELMARYPQYITKTDLGLCSDGVHHLYRYDFQMPETYHTGSLYSEKKCKAFLMSGIHNEYIAVYGLFYALEELVSNPDLRALLRNVHLIVLPCANPYAMVQEHGTIYLNANGVEIHRNFEVGWVPYDEEGGKQYSGAEPLTEPESIAIDNIMKSNKDMAFVLSAHSFGERTNDGKVMWCSAGTKYTCNLATRIINKLSDSWIDRFGDELLPGIESYAPENYANGDYRLGWVSVSGTGGSEYRQAAKYGIHGFNMEVASVFAPHGTITNKEPAYSSFGISRYAEVYANVLLTAFGVYDYKDKDKYVKYLRG